AGQRPGDPQGVVEVTAAAVGVLVVGRSGRRQLRGDHAVRIEARRDLEQRGHAPDHQPAPASRKSETATCAPTSSERRRTAGAPDVPWAPSFRASATSTLLARSASTSAKSIVVATVNPTGNASTARSLRTSFSARTLGDAA